MMIMIIIDINVIVCIIRKWVMVIIGIVLVSKFIKVRFRFMIVVGIVVSINNKIFLLISKFLRFVWVDFKVS